MDLLDNVYDLTARRCLRKQGVASKRLNFKHAEHGTCPVSFEALALKYLSAIRQDEGRAEDVCGDDDGARRGSRGDGAGDLAASAVGRHLPNDSGRLHRSDLLPGRHLPTVPGHHRANGKSSPTYITRQHRLVKRLFC